MEAQGTNVSEAHLNFAFFPDVPFLRVLNYLPGSQIERCRGISRFFRKRIDMNRKSLPSMPVYSLTITQWEPKHELTVSDYNEIEPIISICIQENEDSENFAIPKGAANSLKQALERFDHMLPRMFIENLHLRLRNYDDSMFHQLREKFNDLDIKCQNFTLAMQTVLQLDDLRPMILRLEPKNLCFEYCGKSNLFTSAFWQEKLIRDCSELMVVIYGSSGFFDDQVLLNLTQSSAIIAFDSALTLDGIVSFLKEWKAGTREVKHIKLRVRAAGLGTNEFVAMLPWNVERVTDRYDSPSTYTTKIVNSLGKKIKLSIQRIDYMMTRYTPDFLFTIVDEDDKTDIFIWLRSRWW